MWTLAARAELARPAQPYLTCLTDREWQIAQAFLPGLAADVGGVRHHPAECSHAA